jgi:hypothetical protein
LIGNGKSDIGSFADCTLKKSPHLSAYRRRQMTAIPLGFNPISDRAEFFRLTRNSNLSNLDFEGSDERRISQGRRSTNTNRFVLDQPSL